MVPRLLIGFLVIALAAIPATAQSFSSRVLARDIGNVISIVANDFDGDGDVDLIASTLSQSIVFYFDHQPVDTLVATQLYASQGSGRDLAAADFDDDGDLDVAFAAYNENRLVMFRNGPGATPLERFTQESVATNMNGPYALLSGEFSGDGTGGLVTTEALGLHRIRLFGQVGGELEEVWTSALPSGIDPLGLEIADTDNDGVAEILIAGTSAQGGLFVLRRNQTGGYNLTHEVTGFYLVDVAAADLDGDGALDVVGCDYATGVLRRWERTGTGWQAIPLPGDLTHPRSVVIEDFDADGLLDIAATGEGQNNGGGGGVTWWRQTNSGSFVVQSLIEQGGFYGLVAVDYDRDGDLDLLTTNRDTQQIVMYENLMGTPTRIIGHVTSERSGAAIDNVLVIALETGVTGYSDGTGRYELGMIEGEFTLRYSHPCWETRTVSGVQTTEGDTTFADATLRRPDIELPVTSLNLFVQNEQSSTYDLWLHNSGNAALTVSAEVTGIEPNGHWVSVSPAEIEIEPGGDGLLGVTFSPDTSNEGQHEFLGTLTLHTNSCPDTVVNLALVIVVLDVPEQRGGIIPLETNLAPAYPNPFNPTVSLPVEIASGDEFSLRVYDLLGRETGELFNGALTPGRFVFQWNASEFASGRYIAVLQSAHGARWEAPLTLIK